MKDLLRLLKFVRAYRLLFVFAGICMAVSALLDGISLGMIMPLADIVLTGKKIVVPVKLPSLIAGVLDSLNAMAPLALLNSLVIGVIFLFVVKGVFAFLQSYLMNDISQLVIRDIRSRLYAQFQNLSLDFFVRMRGGELMSRITNDVGSIGNAISYGVTDLIYQSLQVVVFAVMIFFLHWKLALISLVLLPLVSWPMVSVGKVIKKISVRIQEKMADINSLLYETILGVRVVKAFNQEEAEIKKFDDVNNAYYKLNMKSTKRMLLLSPFTELIGIAAAVAVLFWEGRQVVAGTVSFGVLGVFLAALLSMMRPFKKLSQVNTIIQQAVAASDRIHAVLDLQPSVREKPGAGKLEGFSRSVVFEGVSFSYAEQPVIRDVSLSVNRGDVLAIVGPSGAGKTTLLDLIPRFYDPSQGRILIDGRDIRDVTLQSLRQQISIVTQETVLFNDSIAANIAYGCPDAGQERIEAAARQAYVHDVIVRQPHGYLTGIGDRGVKLSGGERQRIAIARALLKNAPILILDEATSALDSESERLVQEALNKLMQGRTVFVIAHRLSTVRHASRIVVLDAGRVVEQGTHEQLLSAGGLYHRLYQNQQIQA